MVPILHFVLASFLAGNDNVENSMKDPVIRKYMEETLYNEVIPTLSLSKEDCEEFAKAVIDRFLKPIRRPQIIKHFT